MNLSINSISLNVVVFKKVDDDFIIVNFNDRSVRNEDIKKEDFMGRSLLCIFPLAKEDGFYDLLEESYSQNICAEQEINLFQDKRITGWRYTYISRLESGEILVQYRDLTQEKLTQDSKVTHTRYLEEAQAIAHLGNWTWNIQTNEVNWTDEVFRILGEVPQSFTPTYDKFLTYLEEEDVITLSLEIKHAIETSGTYQFNHTVIRHDNTVRYVRGLGYVKYDKDRNPIELIGTILDITDTEQTKIKLNLMARAIDQMSELVRITDEKGSITYVNNALIKHTHYKEEELLGEKMSLFKSGIHDNKFYKDLWNTILSGETYTNTIINRLKNGDLIHEEMTITPMSISGKIKHFIVTSHDITERKLLESVLKDLATKDTLTGILNRYSINQEIDKNLTLYERYQTGFSILMLDIDFFKDVNDNYGHDVGDIVLKEFTTVISKNVRKNDIFGRWGGEEFIIVLPSTPHDQAISMAKKLNRAVEEISYSSIKQLTASIGVTSVQKEDSNESLIKRVDDALYRAKDGGRNRVFSI